MSRPTLLPALLAASLLTIPFAGADHASTTGVVFDALGGNEWWVEMRWFGEDRGWALPYVRDTGGEWRQMTHPSWAAWNQYALSYHVEPGHLVQFKLASPTEEVVSCWFTHPAGEERCDGTETGGFDAAFHVWGNAGFVGVNVTGTKPVKDVIYTAGEGWGGYLPKLPNGSWGLSTYVPQDVVLTFIAIGPDGTNEVASGCYKWRSVTPVMCPRPWAPWIEDLWSEPSERGDGSLLMIAQPSEDPARLQVRFDGGEFQDMSLQFEPFWRYVLDGTPGTGDHVAEFRLTSSSGEVRCNEVGYHWPQDEEWPLIGIDEPMRFAEAKGNENWVQVNTYWVTRAVAVEAQVNGGTWKPMKLQSWCDWGAAISAPAGSTVRFRGFYPNLTSELSAPMAWPPGGGTTPAFDASFANVKGNAWWIQASVSATGGTLASVDVSLNGGAWKPLQNKGWGWAASHHAPEGTIVQLRATSTTGSMDLSGCYRWVGATPVACPGGGGGGTTPAFDATFRNVRGNEWWVETDVSASGGTLAGVDARVNGGAWVALTKQSYGSWAKSIHAPSGSMVELRARATDGSTDVSSAYRWPPA